MRLISNFLLYYTAAAQFLTSFSIYTFYINIDNITLLTPLKKCQNVYRSTTIIALRYSYIKHPVCQSISGCSFVCHISC